MKTILPIIVLQTEINLDKNEKKTRHDFLTNLVSKKMVSKLLSKHKLFQNLVFFAG